MRTEDGRIIYRCLNGEPEAFGLLVDKYKAGIYAFVYAKLLNFQDAQDVTQDVFEQAYRSLHRLKRWESFVFWLYRIAHNLCKKWLRTLSKRPDREFIEDQAPETFEEPSTTPRPENPMLEVLNEVLESLPETYRQVLTLYYFSSMNSVDIAKALGASPVAIRKRLSRARSELKEGILAMMSVAFEEQRLQASFTFRIVEAVKRIKVQPVSRTTEIPWGLALATGIILAILSIGSHLSMPAFMSASTEPVLSSELSVADIGEIPVDILKISRMPAISSKGGDDYGGGIMLPDQQNAVLLAPRGEGDEWPEESTARFGRGSVKQIAYSPDGKLLASVGTRGISLYDADNLNEIGLLEGHIGDLISVAFSPDGKLVAAGTGWEFNKNYAVHLWEVQDQRYTGTLRGHTDYVNSVAFSPDGKTLASGSDDRAVRLWDVEGRKQIGLLQGDADWLYSVAFSPDGKMLASGSRDNTIHLWDVDAQKQVGLLNGHTKLVSCVAFSPDGETLASGGWDNTVRLWDVNTQKQVDILHGHTSAVDSVAFSPNGKTLASGGWDNTVRLWDVDTQEQIGTLQGHTYGVWSVAFRPDGKILASAGDWLDATVRLWDIQAQEQVGILQGYTGVLSSVAFSPNSKLLASGSWDSTVRLWDVDKQKYVGTLLGHQSWVRSVVFSPDGKLLASACDDETVRLWDVDTRKQVGALQKHANRVLPVAFSPDGKLLASSGDDGTIRLWDVDTQKQVEVLQHVGGSGEMWAVAFSPDGKLLAGSLDSNIHLWDVDRQNQLGVLRGHSSPVLSVSFSPDGETLASGSWDRTVRLWDIGEEMQVGLLQHTDHIGSVAFSPDGKILASGSDDKAVHLWDVDTQEQICLLQEHTSRASCVAFSPDGKWLASGSADGTVLLWEVNLDAPGWRPVEPMGKQLVTWGEVKRTELYQNYPNPFNPDTWIPYQLTQGEDVSIRVYSASGQLVTTLDMGHKPAGAYISKEKAAHWDGRNDEGEQVASNVYFYSIQAGDFAATKKMVVAR